MNRKKWEDPDLPYLPFHFDDWLNSPRIQMMSTQEELCYFRLLLFCWKDGGFKDDIHYMAVICRVRDQDMRHWWESIKPCFEFDESDQLWKNPKMEFVKKKSLETIANRKKKREEQQKGGKKEAETEQGRSRSTSEGEQCPSKLGPEGDQSPPKSSETNDACPQAIKGNTRESILKEDKDKEIYPDKGGKPPCESIDPPAAASSSRIAMDSSHHPAGSTRDIPAAAGEDEGEEELPGYLLGEEFTAYQNYPAPLLLDDLARDKGFLVFKDVRVAALPPAASETEDRFRAPWINPHAWGLNHQNIAIAMMDQYNLMARLPDREGKETGYGLDTYQTLMPDVLECSNVISDFYLKYQLALFYIAHGHDKPNFTLFPKTFFNTNRAKNLVEEKCYKMLLKHLYSNAAHGIPVMLLVETGVNYWALKPALVWGWNSSGKNSVCRPVYKLLSKDGRVNPKSSFEELPNFKWDYYDYNEVKKRVYKAKGR